MKFSLMTHSLGPDLASGRLNVFDALKFAKSVGFEAIEFSLPHIQVTDVNKIKKSMDELGLETSCINGLFELASYDEAEFKDAVKGAKAMIDDAVALGASIVMVFPTRTCFSWNAEEKKRAAEKMIEGLREVVSYGNEKNIVVTFEDMCSLYVPFCSIEECRYLLDSVKGLKLTFDNGNFLPSGDEMLDAYEQLGSYTVNVHIKEWQYTDSEQGILCADGKRITGGLHGKGILDHQGMIRALKEKGYNGYIAYEYEGELDRMEAIRSGFVYMRNLIQ